MVCFLKKHCLPLFAVAVVAGLTASLHAETSRVTIGSPVAGTRIAAPVMVRAHNVGCNGARPTSFSYSIDDSRAVYRGDTPYDIDVQNQPIEPGRHIIHFRSATSKGDCPESTTTFTVTDSSTTPPVIPPNATSSGDLETADNWKQAHDSRTPGHAVGTTVYPSTTPLGDDARLFSMDYSNKAGERWSNSFANDTQATNFVFDVYVLMPDPTQIQNLELDINQVDSNGKTILMTTQCSSNSKRWEYGDTVGHTDHWLVSNVPCDTETWTANTWHHIQIGEHHDSSGVVTHDYVILDDVYTPFVGATHKSAEKEGWQKGDVNTQFQIEGSSKAPASASIFAHNLTIYRW